MNRDITENRVGLSCQGILEATTQREQTMQRRCRNGLSSAKEERQILMSALTDTACRFVEKFRLVGIAAPYVWSTVLKIKKSNSTRCFSMHLNGVQQLGSCDVLPGEKGPFNHNSVVIFASYPTTPSPPLVSLNLHSKPPRSHGGCASHLIVPSVVKKSQGYVNKMLLLCEGEFTSPSIDVKPNT